MFWTAPFTIDLEELTTKKTLRELLFQLIKIFNYRSMLGTFFVCENDHGPKNYTNTETMIAKIQNVSVIETKNTDILDMVNIEWFNPEHIGMDTLVSVHYIRIYNSTPIIAIRVYRES